MKRIFIFICIIVIFAEFIPTLRTQAEESGDFEYVIDYTDNNSSLQKVHIISYTGNAENIIIPNTINGHPVAGVGNPSWASKSIFEKNANIKSITISDGITHIWNGALSGCKNLTNIELPDSIVYIGTAAFRDSPQLTAITIPKSVAALGNEEQANTDSYSIHNNNLFAGCTNLAQITVSEDNEHYSSEEGILYNKNKSRLILCPPGKSGTVTIPNGVTEIFIEAFRNCKNLSSITLPNTITNINRHAFCNCEGLVEIIIPNSVKSIEIGAFEACIGLTQLHLPGSIENIGMNAFAYLTNLKTVVLEYGVKSIGSFAFDGCTNLETIYIPDSVETIDVCAFKDCTSLTSLFIPDNVTSISGYAFGNCVNLTKVRLSDNLPHINPQLFYGCSSLVSVNIPKNASRICEEAFAGCNSLTSIQIPDGLKDISSSAFSGCINLSAINIPNSVENIGDHAFQNCAALESICLSESISVINAYTFSGCTNLASISIPPNVAKIGYAAFENCTNLAQTIFYNPNTTIMETEYVIPAVNKNPRDGGHPEIVYPPTFSNCVNLSTIYGFSNSTAQAFAWNQEKNFVPIAKIRLNETELTFDIPPRIIQGRTLVPMRKIFETLGAKVSWNNDTKTITVCKENIVLVLQVDSPMMKINEKEQILDVCPQLNNGTVFIPIRAAAECLNCTVEWDSENQTVIITPF